VKLPRRILSGRIPRLKHISCIETGVSSGTQATPLPGPQSKVEDEYEDLHKLVAFARATFRHPFSSKEIRGPTISAAEESGWEWVPVTARRHATYKSRMK
jgi:hypothetical protein